MIDGYSDNQRGHGTFVPHPLLGRYRLIDLFHSEADDASNLLECGLSAFACSIGTLASDAVEQLGIAAELQDFLSDGSDGLHQVCGDEFLHVAVSQRAVLPFLIEVVVCLLVCAEVKAL